MKQFFGACAGAVICWGLIWAVVAFISADVQWPVDLWNWSGDLAGPARALLLIPFGIATIWALAIGADVSA
jgi:hypothetical protein